MHQELYLIRIPKEHLPATICNVLVKPGDKIEKTQALLRYEYVKKSKIVPESNEQIPIQIDTPFVEELKSPTEGEIQQILVREGDMLDTVDKAVIGVKEPCAHSIQIRGLCALCGNDMMKTDFTGVDYSIRATISMAHNVAGLTVSLNEAERLEKDTAARLLKSRKLSLIVDLDQTLIHATIDPTVEEWINDENNINHPTIKDIHKFVLSDSPTIYYIKLRPGLKEFLKSVSEFYEPHIYTMGTRNYASSVAEVIDPDHTIFNERILSRDESRNINQKNIRRLFPCDDSMVVAIDDRADVWGWSPNLIKVHPYDFFVGIGDINDTRFLKQVKSVDITSNTSNKKPSDEKTYEKTSDEITSDEKISDEKTYEKTSDEITSDEKISDEKTSDEKTSDEKTSDEKISEEKISDEKISDEKISDEKISDEKTSDSDEKTSVSDEKTSVSDEKTSVSDEKTSVSDEKTSGSDEKASVSDEKASVSDEKTSVSDEKTSVSDEKTSVSDEKTSVSDEKTSVSDEKTFVSDEKTSVSDDKTSVSDDKTSKEPLKQKVENTSNNTVTTTMQKSLQNSKRTYEEISEDSVNSDEKIFKKQQIEHDENISNPTRDRQLKSNQIIESVKPVLVDNDTELPNLFKALKEIHKRYYEEYDRIQNGLQTNEESRMPDVTVLVPSMKAEVLKGVNILFTHVIPTSQKKESAEIWILAKEFGAECSDGWNNKVTHLVAGDQKKQFEEAMSLLYAKNGTLHDSIKKWERQPERDYFFDSSSIRESESGQVSEIEKPPDLIVETPSFNEITDDEELLSPQENQEHFLSTDWKSVLQEVDDEIGDDTSALDESETESGTESNGRIKLKRNSDESNIYERHVKHPITYFDPSSENYYQHSEYQIYDDEEQDYEDGYDYDAGNQSDDEGEEDDSEDEEFVHDFEEFLKEDQDDDLSTK
ncbi:41682_t:CDS:10 [Gigaspora margarita]|uniref:RNA polymerase II subunit A C-terminal domain phosphatase n=1 Tax=Gigaspora margarita TaxID=4874 RepID=A0ABN7UTD4_GIGMA|nr:41682_t:CDS:10 [Gigaspora margarita]